MMKRRIEPSVAVVLLIVGLVSLSLSATEPMRGPAGPRLDLECGEMEEIVAGPERKHARLSRKDCLEHSVTRLEAALASDPEIDAFAVRSGEIGTTEIPPSDQWEVGASPEWSDAPAYVIPVRFEEPLRWEPYIITWFPEMETTRPEGGRPGLVIAKENPTPEGFEIHLVAVGGLRVHAVSVGWVAYDTTTVN